MLNKLLPREVEFFKLFRLTADEITQAAREFQLLAKNPATGAGHVKSIQEREHKADEITHTTMKLLHETFITPIDREDIHTLICKLDDVLDYLHAAAQRIYLFEVKVIPSELEQLAGVVVKMADEVKDMVDQLDNLKNPQKLLEACVVLHKYENEGDQLLRAGVARLYREEQDIKNLMKLKEIFELVESSTDAAEDVANVIEGIVLEYA